MIMIMVMMMMMMMMMMMTMTMMMMMVTLMMMLLSRPLYRVYRAHFLKLCPLQRYAGAAAGQSDAGDLSGCYPGRGVDAAWHSAPIDEQNPFCQAVHLAALHYSCLGWDFQRPGPAPGSPGPPRSLPGPHSY